MPPKTIITNVSVVSMASGKVAHDQEVLIDGTRIENISKSQSLDKSNYKIIDGTGKYLMPGLFDMHTHMNDKKFLPLFLMNGITAIRDLGNVDENIFSLREDARTGKVLSPRLFVCGKILEGDPPLWNGFKVVKTKSEAVAAVRELKKKDADFVKVYHTLQPNLYKAIMTEAKKQNMKVTGHIPNGMSAIDVLEAGQGCIEHMSQITRNAGDIIYEDANEVGYEGWRRFTGYKVKENDFQDLLNSLQKHKAYLCPTMVVAQKTAALIDYNSLASSPGASYMDDNYVKEEWNPNSKKAAENIKGVKPLWFKNYGVIFEGSKTLIKRLAEHATILAGTDTPNPFVIPGFALLDELELLVECGLSPYQALQAATTNAAQYLDVDDELGTVEVGKTANLVLLAKDPLKSIDNIKTVEAIVLNGRYHTVAELKSLREKL